MFIVSCLAFFFIISIYLVIYSPYRIRNWNGFLILFPTFTIHSIFIYILPISQFYLLYFLLFIDMQSFHCVYHSLLVLYCIMESFFFLFTVDEARFLNNRPLPKHPPLPKDYDEQFTDRIVKVYDTADEDFRVCLAGWFDHVDNRSYYLIYKENILQFIAMCTYGVKYRNEMTDTQQQHVERLYNRYLIIYPEQRSQIQSGYNNQIRLRNPYRDLIEYTHYPMVKYLLFACVRSVNVMLLISIGYKYQCIDNVPFYIRKYSKTTSSSSILFLHGLSLGVNTYIAFIRRLTSLNRTIILLDVPHASMRLHTEILSISTILSSIQQLLIALNEQHIVTISHSYGTIVHSCIVKQLTHFVCNQPAIFIDPICFLLFDSRYLDHFLYRQPRTPNQLLLYTSCAEDLYSIYHIERHICWYESNLWTEDMKQSQIRVHVFLSEHDDIIPVSFVDAYLKKSHIHTTVFPQFKHGQFLITPTFQEKVLETLHQLEKKPSVDVQQSMDSFYLRIN